MHICLSCRPSWGQHSKPCFGWEFSVPPARMKGLHKIFRVRQRGGIRQYFLTVTVWIIIKYLSCSLWINTCLNILATTRLCYWNCQVLSKNNLQLESISTQRRRQQTKQYIEHLFSFCSKRKETNTYARIYIQLAVSMQISMEIRESKRNF